MLYTGKLNAVLLLSNFSVSIISTANVSQVVSVIICQRRSNGHEHTLTQL